MVARQTSAAMHFGLMCVLCASLGVLVACVVLLHPLETINTPSDLASNGMSLCIVASAANSYNLRLLLISLNFAPYPSGITVHLIVVSPALAPGQNPVMSAWRHGSYRLMHSLPRVLPRCTLLLEDVMEASPIFAFWYLDACRRHSKDPRYDAIVGGGAEEGVGIVLLRRWAWSAYRRHAISNRGDASRGVIPSNITASVARFVSEHNLTLLYPAHGSVYVRSKRQNPIWPEHPPLLERVLRPELLNWM